MGSEEQEQKIKDLAEDAERETRSLEQDGEQLGKRIDETRRASDHKDDEAPDDASDE
jgi:hypothetical protein